MILAGHLEPAKVEAEHLLLAFRMEMLAYLCYTGGPGTTYDKSTMYIW